MNENEQPNVHDSMPVPSRESRKMRLGKRLGTLAMIAINIVFFIGVLLYNETTHGRVKLRVVIYGFAISMVFTVVVLVMVTLRNDGATTSAIGKIILRAFLWAIGLSLIYGLLFFGTCVSVAL